MGEKDNITRLERMAMKGDPIQNNETLPDIVLYQALRNLHQAYRSKAITLEDAKAEKASIVQSYQRTMVMYRCWQNAIEIRNLMSAALTDAEKNGCLRCKRLVRIFDGRDKEWSEP